MKSPFALFVALALSAPARGGIAYIESIDGDLSNNHLAPTPLVLADASNTITGTFGATGVPDVHDVDYAGVTIPAGFELDRLIVLDSDVGGAFSFIGVQAGPVVSNPPNVFDPSPLLGWTHFGSADEGTNILPAMGVGGGAIGFDPPLPPGVYSFWIMELDTARVYNYSFDLHLRPVPGPAPMSLLVAGALVLRRRR